MSDSDDDWFAKDIDEIVQEVQKKKEPTAGDQPLENFAENCSIGKEIPKFSFEDYGGNYELPKHKSDTKQGNKSKRKPTKSEKGFVQTLSYKKLSFISEMSPLNVFLEVTQNDCGYFECFQDDLTSDYLFLLMKVLSKLCDLPIEEFKKDFLTIFVQSKTLLVQVESLLASAFHQNHIKHKKSLFVISQQELVTDLLNICKNIQRLDLVTDEFKSMVEKLLGELSNAGSKFLPAKNQALEIWTLLNKENQNETSKAIYPALDELNSKEEQDLKPNIVEGKYDSVSHYLDIHKSLLREDFIQPLREAITDLKAMKDKEFNSSMKVYKKVRFMLNDILNSKTRKGEMLFVDLKPDGHAENSSSPSPENNWVNPKKLMFGSLLCFSTSIEFNDLVLAVVSNRDVETILKGYIQVEIIQMYNVASIFNTDFIMLESEVYFEPYHHVYRVLKSLDEHNFPMCNYIVNVDKTPNPPDYLVSSSKKIIYEYKRHKFNPLQQSTYPPEKILQLDRSQLEAYHHALSHKFSLIQGPPGTGKTYIGLKIVSTLLSNIDAQVLIICYTNHALDQFLFGILNCTDDIVRMGNQSRNELLDKYNIKQMSDSNITDRRLKACFYNVKNEYMKYLQEFEILQKDSDKNEEKYKKILEIQDTLRKLSRKMDELKQITEYNLVKDKRVIGMTTTCAARCNLLLQLLKTPVVIAEEAAEVLESHIVASLTNETQHLILIGDHQQLRPTTSVYRLSQKYKMDISLFERMVNNNLNCVCLTTQHRMRGEIANLLRPVIYKNLLDHECVKKYDNIKGVKKNLFFITHNFKESKFTDETTKRNVHEAQFLIALANYLLIQGYKSEDIVLLTTYNGQMIQLLNERKQFSNLQKIKVTVVDNFQGEESKIVLLSLVRNNDENRIGYLGMKNRICVALSRAKEGLFIIGNMDFLAKHNSIWKDIKETLVKQECIGESLPLYCERHNMTMPMTMPADFESVKFGGCQERCDFELECGHKCGYMCHWNGFEHFANCGCS